MTPPIDFRKGHDSLAAMVKAELRKDPFTGTVFVFRARKGGSPESALLRRHRAGDGLQAAGGAYVYLAQDHATQWLWIYNNDRAHMGIGGITPAQKLKMAA